MAKVKRTEIFEASKEHIFSILKDYESYPEFVDGVSAIQVLDRDGDIVRAKYSLNLIKKFSYIIRLKEEGPERLSWEFESGYLFKMNTGSWDLKSLDENRTEVTYSLEVEFKGFAPKPIVSKLTEKSLPAMMASYRERCEE